MRRTDLIQTGAVVLAGALLWAWAGPAAAESAPDPGSSLARVAASFVETARQHLRAGEYREAAADFKAALELDPALSAARQGLAQAQAALGIAPAPAKEVPKDETKPVPVKSDDAVQAQASLRALASMAHGHLEAARYALAAQEFERILDGAQTLAAQVDVSAIEKDAREGLRAAREALKGPKTEAVVIPDVKVKGALAPDEKQAAAAAEFRAAMDNALGAVAQMRIPQTDDLVKSTSLPSRFTDISRARRIDHTFDLLGRPDEEDKDATNLIRAKLLKKISVKFDNQPFSEVVDYLRAAVDINILVDQDVLPTTVPVRNFEVVGMELQQVLWYLMQTQKLDYKISNGAVFISNATGIAGKPVTVIHDIADLTVMVKNFRVGDSEGGITGPKQERYLRPVLPDAKGETESSEQHRQGEDWARFVRASIAAQTWGGETAVAQNTIAYRNGKLVVTHTPEVQEQIRELLASFRKARAIQVAILARFIEINEDFLDDLGIKWSGLAGANNEFGVVDTGTGADFFRGGMNANTEVPLGATGQKDVTGLTIETGLLKKWQLQMVLTAVKKERRGNILTAPRVTCFNTQRAFLTVSTRRNFVRSYDADGNPEIGQVNDGIVFEVQPFVSADRRYITLELIPQVNMVGAFDEFTFRRLANTATNPNAQDTEDKIQLPQVTTRQIMTTVSVPDGGTLMVGGLAQGTTAEGFSTVPFLGDLPLIKYLVTSRRKVDSRDNLIVLVTAHIIQQEEE